MATFNITMFLQRSFNVVWVSFQDGQEEKDHLPNTDIV